MSSDTSSCGFVENGWTNAIAGIDAALARDPNFGRELLEEPDEEEAPSRPPGLWARVRTWLTFRRDRRDIYERLAPRDALY